MHKVDFCCQTERSFKDIFSMKQKNWRTVKVNDERNCQIPFVMSVQEMAEILRIGRNSAYDLVRSKKVQSVRVGHQIRISREALLKFIQTNV